MLYKSTIDTDTGICHLVIGLGFRVTGLVCMVEARVIAVKVRIIRVRG